MIPDDALLLSVCERNDSGEMGLEGLPDATEHANLRIVYGRGRLELERMWRALVADILSSIVRTWPNLESGSTACRAQVFWSVDARIRSRWRCEMRRGIRIHPSRLVVLTHEARLRTFA